MEQYEVYFGRLELPSFCKLVLRRHAAFRDKGRIFACAFFQNIMEALMLYARYTNAATLSMKRCCKALANGSVCLIRLTPADISTSIDRSRLERVNA